MTTTRAASRVTSVLDASARTKDRPPLRWVYDARTDGLLAWAWVPFFLGAHVLGRFGADRAVAELFAVVLLVSLVHQPLTLLVVYGDREQWERRPWFFTVAPLVVALLVAVAVDRDLWVLVPIGAAWNAIHTLQQRYGIVRIYGRKAGYGSARLDRALVYTSFLAATGCALLLPQTAGQLSSVATTLGSQNVAGIELFLDHTGLLVLVAAPLVALFLAVAVAYVRKERQAHVAGGGSPAKWAYLLANGALLASLLVDPLAGFIAYVAAHAIEYVVVVGRTLVSRRTSGSAARADGPQRGRAGAVYARLATFMVAAALLATLAQVLLPGDVYVTIIYTVGVLHFTYDALIWKVRRPAVAKDFGVVAAPGRPG